MGIFNRALEIGIWDQVKEKTTTETWKWLGDHYTKSSITELLEHFWYIKDYMSMFHPYLPFISLWMPTKTPLSPDAQPIKEGFEWMGMIQTQTHLHHPGWEWEWPQDAVLIRTLRHPLAWSPGYRRWVQEDFEWTAGSVDGVWEDTMWGWVWVLASPSWLRFRVFLLCKYGITSHCFQEWLYLKRSLNSILLCPMFSSSLVNRSLGKGKDRLFDEHFDSFLNLQITVCFIPNKSCLTY